MVWFAETSALPPSCSFQVSLQGISGVAQVLPTHYSHQRRKDPENSLRGHFELMMDAGSVAFSRKNESVASRHASSRHLHAGQETDLFVWPEFSELLQRLADTLDFKLELRALPSFARCEFSSAWRGRVPAGEVGDIDYGAEYLADRSINNLRQLYNGHVGLLHSGKGQRTSFRLLREHRSEWTRVEHYPDVRDLPALDVIPFANEGGADRSVCNHIVQHTYIISVCKHLENINSLDNGMESLERFQIRLWLLKCIDWTAK